MSDYRYFLNAGIDFGTSYTKVYVEDQFTGLRKPVLFGDEQLGLIPSFVRHCGDRITGPMDGAEGITVPYLKLFIADEASGRKDFERLYRAEGAKLPPARVLVTGYFHAVLKHIERFLREDPDWKDFSLGRDLLSAQVAVPTGLQDGGSDMDAQILDCLKAAMQLARNGDGSPTTAHLSESLDSLTSLSEEAKAVLQHSCSHYPEVAAAVQAMLRSGDLPEGKYLTMDIGAGTVDLNFFFKRGTAKDRDNASIDTWVAKVVPLGCACLGKPHAGAGAHERTGIGMEEALLSQRLRSEIRTMMQQVFTLQPRKVAGNGPDVFHHGVHAYIFGGGANVPVYGTTLQKTLEELDVRITQVMRLPRPDINFATPKGIDDFGRLAVAYGISASAENMEVTRLPEEMHRILKRSLLDSIKNIESIEIACTCVSNPTCARCHGTGLLQGRDLRANLEAISLYKAHEEAQQKANPTPSLRPSPTEKYLNNLITQYGEIIKFRARNTPVENIIFYKYRILKEMERCLLELSSKRRLRWEADTHKIFQLAANEPWRKVFFERGSAKLHTNGLQASADISLKIEQKTLRPIYFTCLRSSANLALKAINEWPHKPSMVAMEVKLNVSDPCNILNEPVGMDVKPSKNRELI
jgi:hypothetical protein